MCLQQVMTEQSKDDRTRHPQPQGAGPRRSAFAFIGRYVGVGLFVAGTDYLVFLLALAGEVGAVWANVLSRVASTIVGATLHRAYTFAGPQRLGYGRQMLAYGTLSVVNLGLSSGMLHVLVDLWSVPALWAKIGTDVIITVVSMAVSRFLVFAPSR